MDRPERKNLRLPHYDYSQAGYYFVTLCTHKMKSLFGMINMGKMECNRLGNIVEQSWRESSKLRQNIVIHEYIVMPNHFHGIVEICKNSQNDDQPKTMVEKNHLGNIVKGFKSQVTSLARSASRQDSNIIWQRGFHEHIIRNESSLLKIREYVINNPLKWELDRYYSDY